MIKKIKDKHAIFSRPPAGFSGDEKTKKEALKRLRQMEFFQTSENKHLKDNVALCGEREDGACEIQSASTLRMVRIA